MRSRLPSKSRACWFKLHVATVMKPPAGCTEAAACVCGQRTMQGETDGGDARWGNEQVGGSRTRHGGEGMCCAVLLTHAVVRLSCTRAWPIPAKPSGEMAESG